jgi:hypothetical protein
MRYRFVAGLSLGLAFTAGVAYAVGGTMAFFATAPSSNGQCVTAATDGTLTAVACTTGGTGTANTWTAAQTFSTRVSSTPVTLSQTSPAPDASLTNVFTLLLSQNVSMPNPINLVAGETLTFIITQAATTGNFTVTWGAGYKWAGGTAPTMTGAVGKVDVYTCTSQAGTNCYMAGVSQNF